MNNTFKTLLKKIQSKDDRIGTHEINKISLSRFDDNIYIYIYVYIYIQNNGCDGLVLAYQS